MRAKIIKQKKRGYPFLLSALLLNFIDIFFLNTLEGILSYHIFREKLVKLLNVRELTQYELSKKTGFSSSAINRYINGEREPRYEAIEKLSKALKVSPAFFFPEYNYDISPRTLILPHMLVDILYENAEEKLFIVYVRSFKEIAFNSQHEIVKDKKLIVTIKCVSGNFKIISGGNYYRYKEGESVTINMENKEVTTLIRDTYSHTISIYFGDYFALKELIYKSARNN